MRKRILKHSGVLNMLQAVVMDGDGLWNRYGCDSIAEEKGYEVRHFDDDMAFRHYSETVRQSDPRMKRIMVIDGAAFGIPYDIDQAYPVVDVSLHGVFPILNEEALR